ncbi:hypothetical protein BB561_004983 [Smittium simulii]|uniref:MIP18 family-like domain-containing protein n=1 Tax=Smittium simulii TaxID=133385 RepID=A0A2T9YD04_9FUNG|nr:hypothetical protein BB561_004983 [Smittium simulii]
MQKINANPVVYNKSIPDRRVDFATYDDTFVDLIDSHEIFEFTPTIPHCSMATLIGLSIRVCLIRNLPSRFKIDVKVRSGTHNSEAAINKQLNDKERVSAALENSNLLEVDTEVLYSKAIQLVLDDYNATLSRETAIKMIGQDTNTATRILLDDTRISISPQDFVARVDEAKLVLFKQARLIDGAEKLVTHLHKNNIPISIATCSPRSFFDIKASNHKPFFKLFGENITCGDDPTVHNLKPYPDIYSVAKNKLCLSGICDRQCLVFEDAINGVRSGVAANMNVVWIPDKRFCSISDIPDHKHGACEMLSSLLDFVPEKYGLPPYDD